MKTLVNGRVNLSRNLMNPDYMMNYIMYLHKGMYGVPMGPVVSEDPMIQDRWDLYRLFRGLDYGVGWWTLNKSDKEN